MSNGTGTGLQLPALHAEWRHCTRCRLAAGAHRHVLGNCVGPEVPPRLVVIGEAPGEAEDVLGTVFVGRAGGFLRYCLQESGLIDVPIYLTNLVCCMPRDDSGKPRQPYGDEIHACKPRLVHALRLIRPEVVLVLGMHPRYYVQQMLDSMRYTGMVMCLPSPASVLRKGERGCADWNRYIAELRIVAAWLAE